MRGLADAATGYIKDIGERDFTPVAGELVFRAPADVTPATVLHEWRRSHRVNSDATVRAATAQEQTDFDVTSSSIDAISAETFQFDGMKLLKASNLYWQNVNDGNVTLLEQMVGAINQLRTNPTQSFPAIPRPVFTAPTPAQIRAGILAIYRSL